MQQIIKKNPVRLVFIYFIYDILDILQNRTEYSVNTLQTSISYIKENWTEASLELDQNDQKWLKTVLNQFEIEIIDYAKNVSNQNIVNKQQLLYDLFDGIPLTDDVPINRLYDMVVEETPNRAVGYVWCSTKTEIFDKLQIQIEIEKEFKIPCTDIKILNTIPDVNPDEPKKRKKNNYQKLESSKSKSNTDSPIGRILFSKKYPTILSENSQKDKINAVVFESHAESILPNTFLKLVSEDETKSVYCRITAISVEPISGHGIQKQFSELSTVLTLRPILEKKGDYAGKPRPGDLTRFDLKRLSAKELINMLHIPERGLPLGKVDYDDVDHDFLFPLEPDTSIYQSMTIAGVQGKGKTSFIKLLIMSLTSVGENDA